ncbi:MAG: thioesterase family protein [Bacteroidales bacterium]|nr:thioesterase family protein [Bacteroidales bacterium]
MLQPGIIYFLHKKVEESDSARVYGSGLVDVLSTPAMIAFMEKTCLEMVEPYLEPGHNTVGSEVHIQHLKPTPIGDIIYCRAELIEIAGKKLTFNVEVSDSKGLVGKGTHTRFIINVESFMSRLNKTT